MRTVGTLKTFGAGTARLSVAATCGAAILYAIGCSPSTPEEQTGLLKYRTGELDQLQIPGELEAINPKLPEMERLAWPDAAPAPTVTFEGPDGEQVSLADFHGNITVVNMWATWCAPCKVEMPTLAALATAYADEPVKVVAISADVEEDYDKAKVEIARNAPLDFYYTPGIDFSYEFQPAANSFPTTIIYDKAGVERARLIGDTDWSSEEAHDLIDALLAEG